MIYFIISWYSFVPDFLDTLQTSLKHIQGCLFFDALLPLQIKYQSNQNILQNCEQHDYRKQAQGFLLCKAINCNSAQSGDPKTAYIHIFIHAGFVVFKRVNCNVTFNGEKYLERKFFIIHSYWQVSAFFLMN